MNEFSLHIEPPRNCIISQKLHLAPERKVIIIFPFTEISRGTRKEGRSISQKLQVVSERLGVHELISQNLHVASKGAYNSFH